MRLWPVMLHLPWRGQRTQCRFRHVPSLRDISTAQTFRPWRFRARSYSRTAILGTGATLALYVLPTALLYVL